MTDTERPIFIIGLRRSGSTLWQNIIAMDDTIARFTEMMFYDPWHHDIRKYIKCFNGDIESFEGVKNLVDDLLNCNYKKGLNSAFWRFENFEDIVNDRLKMRIAERIWGARNIEETIFKAIIEELTTASGYSRCCVKFPVWVNHISDLIKWYPKCRIVHITRDPRATAISKTNDPTGTALKIKKYPYAEKIIKRVMMFNVVTQYVISSYYHEKYKTHSNYLLFRYEDLLLHPKDTVKELCKFIQIPYSSTSIDLDKGYHEHQPSSITMKRRKVIDPEAANRWRNYISKFDYRWITALTKSSMRKYEYFPGKYFKEK